MPVMSGIEAAQKIREFEQTKKTDKPDRILAVSANEHGRHSQRATEVGMDGYITKPFQKKDIIAAVEQV